MPRVSLLVVLLFGASAVLTLDEAMSDLHQFWAAFRDPQNGLWCDKVLFSDTTVCGDEMHRHYSSAGVGMGLISDAVFSELGLFDRVTGQARAMQTLESLRSLWPKEKAHGYYAHWVSAPDFTPPVSTSTVDTAEMALGALFAGNYFGGEVAAAAHQLVGNISWTAAISNNTIIGGFDFVEAGKPSHGFKPFNEYYTVSYLADIYSESASEPAALYFDRYWGRNRKPTNQQGCPAFAEAFGYELITGGCTSVAKPPQLSHFVSSFAPLFNHYMTKGFHINPYYAQTLMPNWRLADMAYWDSILNASTEVWGHPAKGHVWGCGAGPSPGTYGVDTIGHAVVASPHIMAGFLDGANATLTSTIKGQLGWMRRMGACMYTKAFSDGSSARVPWRCSIADPKWRADSADVIDFSTMVLGYATTFLPDDFYGAYVA